MENSDKDEILRLRRIIERLEASTGTRVISTEIVPREDRGGFLIYVTAPTAANEMELGIAISTAVMKSLRVVSPQAGIGEKPEWIDASQVKPTPGLPEIELFAWIGRDEFGSGEVGLKQGVVPAGIIPMVSIRHDRVEKYWDQAELQAKAYGQQISLVKFRPMEVLRRTVAGNP